MQLVFFIAILFLLLMPIDSYRKAPFRSSDTTFLSNDDFSRAQNMSFSEAESAPMPVPLNDPEMQYTYYEGDMMIQESDEAKVAMYTAKRWPHGRIPYIMENKFSEEERAAIARGIMILQERTCIRFVPKRPRDHDYVLMKRGPGCAAHVGRIGGQQWVILGDGCYGIETVTHELMHSVGFIHEQSRPDRDEHVEIVWENIKQAAKRNFKKHDHDYLSDNGFPYDLMSVMHYRQYAFSKNRKPTILPKRSVPYLRCRGMDCPSEMDIKKINFLYKCHKRDDYYDDNFVDKDSDSDNEVSIDEILPGKGDDSHGGMDDHYSPDDLDHNGPCMDDDCFKSRRPFRRIKSMHYPGYQEYSYSEDDFHHPREGRMHKIIFPKRSNVFKFLPRNHRISPHLISPMMDIF